MNQNIFVVIEHVKGQVSDISYVMLAAARKLADANNGKTIGILLGKDAKSLANDLAADQVIYFDDPKLADFTSDAYKKTLEILIQDEAPRAVIFGNTTIGADIAGGLSMRLNLPLIRSCINFDEQSKYIAQIMGGKIMVDGELPSPTSLVTMIPGSFKPEEGQSDQPPPVEERAAPSFDELRVSLVEYFEPEAGDVDISKEPVLISVGRGVQTEDNIELAEELADAMGATVCASRPVVDQGWLPTNRLVGKSGLSVKPKLYLAMGISGAPEHVEGITDCETIVAINTDPTAPIFDIAQYGSTVDMLDLLEVLIELVEEE